MKRILLLTTTSVLFCVAMLHAQNVFNPADTLVRYNASATLGSIYRPDPTKSGLQKWVSVATNGISTGSGAYDVTSFKAYFINIGGSQMCFRLKFPKSYADSPSKKYPIMVFFHGAGEPGCNSNGGVYNNELQLANGGKTFRDYVDNGKFDGFLFYPQNNAGSSCSGNWGIAPYSPYYNLINNALDSITKYVRMDQDKVFVDGLSNGGAAAWSMTATYPQRVAKAAPSAAATGSTNYSDFVHIPIWFATGGKDTNPTPAFGQAVYDALKNVGADITYTLYPTLGHSVWGTHWAEANWIPFMNETHKANPLVFFQRYEFCSDSPISAKIGITAGFYAYEWQKDGVTIATNTNGTNTIVDGTSIITYTGNDITVKAFGTYRVRFKRTSSSAWSDWSNKPAVIKSKPVTQTPQPVINGSYSNILPAPDGKTTVPLKLPTGYVSYQWFQGSTVVGTDSIYNAQPGTYTAKVVEQYGCGALASSPYTVISASGSPKPEAAKNLSAAAVSLTSIQLDWSDNPNAAVNETGFEIYRSTTAGGPYTFVAITNPNVVTYTNTGLSSNTQYYYIVRAVGASGAAAVSNEAGSKTAVDNTGPTAPANLFIKSTATNYVNIAWTGSTDDVGVYKYDIFVNGAKTYTTTETSFTVANLDSGNIYNIYVKARDLAGNYSSPSNQVTVSTSLAAGLSYKYYEGTWSNLPDFNATTIVKSGFVNNIDMTPMVKSDYFGFLWEGYILIPTTATYTFKLTSDDGSRLWIDKAYGYSVTPDINNDGAHGSTAKSVSLSLTAGYHQIAVGFFDVTGSNTCTLTWANNAGLSETAVPNSAFFRTGQVAANLTAPSNLVATTLAYNKIQLTWDDNSSNETGFEILRSTSATGTFTQVTTVAGTSYVDSGLAASTKYFYKIRAIGGSGESVYASNYTEVNWKGNTNLNDSLGSTTRSLSNNNVTYSTAEKKEGVASFAMISGSNNQYLTVSNSQSGGFPSDGGYTQRTVALWIKPTTISNNKIIFEFGNSTNGLALKYNGGTALQAGIASAGTRGVATLSNFTSNANWVLNGWNHVAVVYNVSSLKIFLNGVQVAANDALGITSVAAAASNASRFGMASGTSASDNAFNVAASSTNDYYKGYMDDIYVINGALSSAELNKLKNFTFAPSYATTAVTPATPAAPTSLTAQAVSGDVATITWNDNASDETGYEIYRSTTTNTNYRKIATVTAGTGAQKSYTDTTLFANVTFYYKVRATGLAASSDYSNEASVTTPNTVPAFSNIADFTVKYGTTHTLVVNANDPDGDQLTFTAANLPAFVSIVNNNDGTANIVSSPALPDQGSYTITLYVADAFGGKDTVTYTMVVNNNNLPVISTIADVSISELETKKVALVATDADGNNSLTWAFDSKPVFANLVDSGNGRASVTFTPGLTAAGTYTMTVRAEDGLGGRTIKTFNITVADKDPNETIQVNMKYWTAGGTGWNDVETNSGNPFSLYNMKNTKGTTTSVGINMVSGTYGSSDAGVQSSSVFPATVMKDGIFWGYSWQGGASADTLRVRISGLDATLRYNFIFMASNNCTFCNNSATSKTTFKIGDSSAVIPFYMNANTTDTIYQVVPSATGEVFITMIGDPDAQVGGTLNALVINAAYDDGTVPAKPESLVAEAITGVGVKLTWADKAYNETGYKVYRSLTQTGTYSVLKELAPDAATWTDSTVAPYTQYFYYVVAANKYGTGATSDTAAVTTANSKPVIAGLVTTLALKTDASVQDDFTVTDTPGDVLTVSLVNNPSYVTLQSLGSGSYKLLVSPSASDIGNVTLTVKAADDKGGEATSTVSIAVTDKNTRSWYLNMANYNESVAAPWNNLVGYGNAGTTVSNLKDETNTTTSVGFQLVNGWAGINTNGHKTGNNSGVFPDSVLSFSIWDNSTTARQVKFTGLDDNKRYNVVIVGSMNEGLDASVRYSSGSSSDTLNARYNTNQTANLNNLTSSGGVITVDMLKLSTATYLYLNAIKLEEFTPGINLNPVNLYVEPIDRSSVALSWSDRTSNEDAATGFQLQRSTDANFSNVVTINLPANTTTYTNTGLAANTKYWYRVRAVVDGTPTDWSNVGKTITLSSLVYVNFNYQSAYIQDAPWYNLNVQPTQNFSFSNLSNQANQPTGITLSIEKVMNGDNNFGVNTGNNSGVAPDKVLQSNYWIDNTQQSQMKLTGLNQAKRYRIGFLGSMSTNGWFQGNYTCTYTINGRTVYLNSWMNSTKIVYIGNIQADSNGELLIDFSTTAAANYGFNAGMIIETYDDVTEGGTVLNRVATSATNDATITNENARLAQTTTVAQELTGARMYPNPFIDQVNLDFNNTTADNNISVEVYDISGKLMYRKAYGKLAAGYNTIRVNPGTKLNTGLYLVTLSVNGKPVQVSKMVKTNQ